MKIEYESGINEDGNPRNIEVNRRDDGSVYFRVKQPRQDCYLEERELVEMLDKVPIILKLDI